MSDPQKAWNALSAHLRDVELFGSLSELVGWDQQTMMPPGSADARSDHESFLSRLAHEAISDPRVGAWLDMLEGARGLNEVQRAALRLTRRRHDRAVKVPATLVAALARAQSEGFGAWLVAKERNDWASFAPRLERLVGLTAEMAQAIDASRHPYDVLLEPFDPGSTVVELRAMFERLRDGLGALIGAIEGRPAPSALTARFPLEAQRGLNEAVAAAIGFDFERGRIDASEHPFSTGIHPSDVRLTTHLYADDLLSGLGGTIHEAGHGMYEQGLPTEWPGTLVGQAASFGLHESQSRFWENFIGRSLPFFRWMAPVARTHLGVDAPDADTLYAAANRVAPSLIRVSADEVTYNLHIIVRFELELALFEGRLAVADLPEAWNERYASVLGLRPPTDREGVLQDVHWATGAFAYFPSYTLGNLYGASLGRQLQLDLPDLWAQVERGEFAPTLAWLRERIHRRGSLRDAPEIVRDVVGERDMVADLLDHLWSRHGALYGVSR